MLDDLIDNLKLQLSIAENKDLLHCLRAFTVLYLGGYAILSSPSHLYLVVSMLIQQSHKCLALTFRTVQSGRLLSSAEAGDCKGIMGNDWRVSWRGPSGLNLQRCCPKEYCKRYSLSELVLDCFDCCSR